MTIVKYKTLFNCSCGINMHINMDNLIANGIIFQKCSLCLKEYKISIAVELINK